MMTPTSMPTMPQMTVMTANCRTTLSLYVVCVPDMNPPLVNEKTDAHLPDAKGALESGWYSRLLGGVLT